MRMEDATGKARARIRAAIIAALAVAALGLATVSSSPAARERVDVNSASLGQLTGCAASATRR
jgi:hypothetical protein